MAEVTIIIDDKEHTIQVGSETILEAALKAGVDAPFSCRSAICSTCMAQLIEGTVEMEMNHVLTDEELEEGFIVTCQSHPTTDKVKISYDY
ncbi:MAG: 2Fe-2S iron-sulfur cluster binding domain-containing protein [Flavobacteriales bacterium]|nr:2Fe-2S iron-sulfur cluster binding domain-containing protein [Flavobacteriales bacterium]